MEETKTVTPIEGLNIVANELGRITIPASMIEQIGLPLARCINNLSKCIDALNQCKIVPNDSEQQQENQELNEVIDMSGIDLGEDGADGTDA